MGDTRQLPVPDGLDGMRVDAGLSRLLGLSRTVVVTLTEEGRVAVDGHAAGKSDRLVAGSWLEVDLPDAERPTTIAAPAEVVAGLTILHEDDDIVVVDKPVGVAAHPSPGWTGPTVLQRPRRTRCPRVHLRRGRAAGHRAPARRRHHRGHGRREVRARLQRAQAGVQGTHRRQALPRRRPGPPGPVARHGRRADRPPPEARLQVRRRRRRPAERHPLRHDRGVPGGVAARRPAGDRAHPPDPGAHGRVAPPVRRRHRLRRRPGAGRSGWGWSGSGCTPARWASTTRPTGGG